jgi:hypothetical protein
MTQARQITGGRKPLVPVEYEEGCKMLDACISLDDVKYWDNAADALAAWAKIYHDDEASTKAKRLKLKAYRRLGELAEQLRPTKVIKKPNGDFAGESPGSVSLLREHGFTHAKAGAARKLAKMPEKRFAEIVNSPKPVSPTTACFKKASGSDAWVRFAHDGQAVSFRSFCRRTNPQVLARAMDQSEASKAREFVREVQEWLDTFEQFLPKAVKQ